MRFPAAAAQSPGSGVDQTARDAATAAQSSADAKAQNLVPTTVKTGAYTAAAGDFVLVDTTNGNIAITLPTAPADKARVGVKHILRGGGNTVTIARGGTTDVFNKAGGSTSLTLTVVNQSTIVQYQASSGVWIVQSGDTPLSQLDIRFPKATSKGKIVWIVDDALVSQIDAAGAIEAVGGKLNVAVPWSSVGAGGSTMVASQVTDLYQRGHQIMSHSLTHPDMTAQTAAQRQAEWDTSKSNLEAITAVGAITDFVFPNNTSNLTLLQEAYGRYVRTFSGSQAPMVFAPGETALAVGRTTWGQNALHQAFLAGIRRIAVTGETLVVYCHDTATAGVSGISTAMRDEAIALATSLGVRFCRADEAIIGHQPFFDAGFESGDLTNLFAITTKLGASVIDIVTDTPSTGLSGTKSLRIVGDGTAGTNRVSVLPQPFVPRPSEEWTMSCRMRQDKTSGTGGGQLIVRQWSEDGTNLGDVNTTALNAGGTGITAWTQQSVAFVPNKLTRVLTAWCAQPAMIGTTWFDHIHCAPTRFGVLG